LKQCFVDTWFQRLDTSDSTTFVLAVLFTITGSPK